MSSQNTYLTTLGKRIFQGILQLESDLRGLSEFSTVGIRSSILHYRYALSEVLPI